MSLVDVHALTVDYGTTRAVDDLSFTLRKGAALGLVGESGSGKSTVAAALLGLHRGTGARVGGSVVVAGTDVQQAGDEELRALRGARAAMVFQDPLSSLDPYYAVGDQIAEVYRAHRRASRRAARARAVRVLDQVGIPDAARRARSRPHEFSGGMRQRALIAMAIACEPDLIVADEPTTALDVTVQAQILDLLHGLRQDTGMGLLLVTHDVGVAAESVEQVLVMQDGRVVERGPIAAVLRAPTEPYTRELLSSVPRVDAPTLPHRPNGAGAGAPVGHPPAVAGGGGRGSTPSPPPPSAEAPGAPATSATARPASTGDVLLTASGLRRDFGRGRRARTAVDGVSLTLHTGQTLGVVGESGSGKTTLGRMLVGLLRPTAGTVTHGAVPPRAQMIFQDPVASLNPRRSIGEAVADPLRAQGERDGARLRARVGELLVRVGLDPAHYDRYPHEFSGGQRQRVGIARALAPEPDFIVCDEPVSSLDVTTQAQVIALLAAVQREFGLALVFIAHDLAVVRQVSDRVVVMRQGTVVEQGTVEEVYRAPREPYTRRLLAAVPSLDPAAAERRRSARRALTTAP